jgi:AcrR family transcriptional regulator
MRGLNAGKKIKQQDERGSKQAGAAYADDDEYKRRILHVASELIVTGRFEQTTMSQIARQAEIGQGSLYRRYANKGDICSELMRQSSEKLLMELERGPAPGAIPTLLETDSSGKAKSKSKGKGKHKDKDKSKGKLKSKAKSGEMNAVSEDGSTYRTVDRIEWTLERIVDFIDEQNELLYVIKSEFTGKHQLTPFEHPFFQRLNALIAGLLDEAAERGEIKPLHSGLAANVIIAAASPDVYLYQSRHHEISKEAFFKGILRIFKTGLLT